MHPEYRLLRAFLAVAEHRHFGRAAAALHLAQPALSKQVAKLESAVGGPLFRRTSRQVVLTTAGQALVPEAERAVGAADAALRRARDVARGQAGTLRVGFMAGAVRPAVLRAFEQRHPEVAVEYTRYEWYDQVACLRDGRADAAFVCLPVDTDGLQLDAEVSEPRLVVLPRDHRFRDRAEVSIAELADEPVIGYHRAPPEWTAFSAVDPRPDGSAAVYGPAVDTVEEKLEYTAAGRGICLVPAALREYYARADLAFVPVPDIPPCRTAVARPAGPVRPAGPARLMSAAWPTQSEPAAAVEELVAVARAMAAATSSA